MSGWQDDAIDEYLENVTEREFDSVFLALLHASGFREVHHLHGAFEFGKDFIAQREGIQWAFQTKAGDIGLGAWRQIRSQVDEMLWNDIAHPGFDSAAERRAVLVTTGRLTGGAPAEAQQYRIALGRRSGSLSAEFHVWDHETLAPMLRTDPFLSIDSWQREPLRDLLGLLADVDRRAVTTQSIERATKSWGRTSAWPEILATALLCDRLKAANRLDLACATTLALARAAAISEHLRTTSAPLIRSSARAMFREFGSELLLQLQPLVEDPHGLHRSGQEVPGSVAYSVRCSVALQTAGMLGLLQLVEGDHAPTAQSVDFVERFVAAQPGAAHPISDRWAVSIVPAAILLHSHSSPALEPWLRQVAAWICDRHDRQPGLASVYASAEQELKQLLGEPYEHLDVARRKQSFVASVVLDLASILQLNSLYEDALNDFLAVDLAFPVMEPADELGQYFYDGPGLFYEANVAYDEEYAPEGWARAVHHRRAPGSYTFGPRRWELGAACVQSRSQGSALPALAPKPGAAIVKPQESVART